MSSPSFRYRLGPCAAIALMALAAGPSRADFVGLLNIDFKDTSGSIYTGPLVVGAAGDTWNPFATSLGVPQTGSNLPLLDASSAATSVTLSYETGGAFPAGTFPAPIGDVMNDYFYKHTQTGPGSFTLSGLTANATYDLYLYANSNFDKSFKYTVNGVDLFLLNDVTVTTLTENVNYLKQLVAADAAGNINVLFTGGPTVTGADDFEGLISAVQLQSPTPVVVDPGPAAAPLPPALFAGLFATVLVHAGRKRLARR